MAQGASKTGLLLGNPIGLAQAINTDQRHGADRNSRIDQHLLAEKSNMGDTKHQRSNKHSKDMSADIQ
ncbi:hypothetical protein SynPROSU1_03026 [Synechococcus sp. PROS-U-1]|nr:hypothetical protein SynPROSU1_03026 [Synechococcus sp. PROS-U-1]